jgi:type II secretory pathway pseudopilin PulG
MLVVCVMLGILAGFIILIFGGSTEKARATKIAADLESVKQAALSYENQNRTRNNNPLAALVNNKNTFTAAVNDILDNPLPADRLALLTRDADDNDRLLVAFENFHADSSLADALDKFVQQHADGGYSGSASGSNYTLRLRLK